MKKVLILASLCTTLLVSFSHAREIPFTDEDRDRLVRLETKVEEGFKRLEEGLKTTTQRIDDLRDLFYVVMGGIIALVGFVMWDRRTALAPAIRRTRDLEERAERIERALRELARQDPKIAEVFKQAGLL
jgi:hypothetical protein